jgi:hypothetical protein
MLAQSVPFQTRGVRGIVSVFLKFLSFVLQVRTTYVFTHDALR